MDEAKKDTLINAGTVLAAVGASLCCTVPLAVALLGVGSAALAMELAAFRPYLTTLTVGLLGFAFYRAYRPRDDVECAADGTCTVPRSVRRQRILLWVVAVVALALVTLPYYVSWLF